MCGHKFSLCLSLAFYFCHASSGAAELHAGKVSKHLSKRSFLRQERVFFPGADVDKALDGERTTGLVALAPGAHLESPSVPQGPSEVTSGSVAHLTGAQASSRWLQDATLHSNHPSGVSDSSPSPLDGPLAKEAGIPWLLDSFRPEGETVDAQPTWNRRARQGHDLPGTPSDDEAESSVPFRFLSLATPSSKGKTAESNLPAGQNALSFPHEQPSPYSTFPSPRSEEQEPQSPTASSWGLMPHSAKRRRRPEVEFPDFPFGPSSGGNGRRVPIERDFMSLVALSKGQPADLHRTPAYHGGHQAVEPPGAAERTMPSLHRQVYPGQASNEALRGNFLAHGGAAVDQFRRELPGFQAPSQHPSQYRVLQGPQLSQNTQGHWQNNPHSVLVPGSAMNPQEQVTVWHPQQPNNNIHQLSVAQPNQAFLPSHVGHSSNLIRSSMDSPLQDIRLALAAQANRQTLAAPSNSNFHQSMAPQQMSNSRQDLAPQTPVFSQPMPKQQHRKVQRTFYGELKNTGFPSLKALHPNNVQSDLDQDLSAARYRTKHIPPVFDTPVVHSNSQNLKQPGPSKPQENTQQTYQGNTGSSPPLPQQANAEFLSSPMPTRKTWGNQYDGAPYQVARSETQQQINPGNRPWPYRSDVAGVSTEHLMPSTSTRPPSADHYSGHQRVSQNTVYPNSTPMQPADNALTNKAASPGTVAASQNKNFLGLEAEAKLTTHPQAVGEPPNNQLERQQMLSKQAEKYTRLEKQFVPETFIQMGRAAVLRELEDWFGSLPKAQQSFLTTDLGLEDKFLELIDLVGTLEKKRKTQQEISDSERNHLSSCVRQALTYIVTQEEARVQNMLGFDLYPSHSGHEAPSDLKTHFLVPDPHSKAYLNLQFRDRNPVVAGERSDGPPQPNEN